MSCRRVPLYRISKFVQFIRIYRFASNIESSFIIIHNSLQIRIKTSMEYRKCVDMLEVFYISLESFIQIWKVLTV